MNLSDALCAALSPRLRPSTDLAFDAAPPHSVPEQAPAPTGQPTVRLLPSPQPPARTSSRGTWTTLGLANQLRARFGEETLTDLLVVDMLPHQRTRGFWLRPTTKHAEGWCGADLFVALRHQTGRWSRLALQAKKLHRDDYYPMWKGRQSCASQLENLERFARQFHALPLYLLYNHSNTAQRSEHWHCSRPFAEGQLGCTLVPSWHIRRMIRRPPPRNFDFAHNVRQSKPWRCAFDCPDAERSLIQMAFRTQHRSPSTSLDGYAQYNWPFEPMEAAWPERLFEPSMTQLTIKDLDRIRIELSEFNRPTDNDWPGESIGPKDRWLYPARFLLVDRS